SFLSRIKTPGLLLNLKTRCASRSSQMPVPSVSLCDSPAFLLFFLGLGLLLAGLSPGVRAFFDAFVFSITSADGRFRLPLLLLPPPFLETLLFLK
ncbi:hypothetical protein PENTCL1PPCAC_14103, partial [Pristionchus entomophagus]